MGIAEISLGSVMGGGAPVYAMPRVSLSVSTTGTTQNASVTVEAGDYLRVLALSGNIAVAINKTATAAPRMVVAAGTVADIGPLKAGDTIALIDV
jgi:hypothetical protein